MTTIAKLNGVAGAGGALTAANVNTTFKVPSFTPGTTAAAEAGRGGGGGAPGAAAGPRPVQRPGSFGAGNQVTVSGVDLPPAASRSARSATGRSPPGGP